MDLHVQEDGTSVLTVIEGIVVFGAPFNTWTITPVTISCAAREKQCTKPAPTDMMPDNRDESTGRNASTRQSETLAGTRQSIPTITQSD